MANLVLNRQTTQLGSNLQPSVSFFDEALVQHVAGMRQSFRYLPDDKYRYFCEWVLEQNEIKDRWLQLTAVIQQIKLAERLLEGILTSDEMYDILPYCVALNTYLTYEVVSDNLGIGLSQRQEGDVTFEKRRKLLHGFNTALSQRLRGESATDAAEMLRPMETLIKTISAFDQSLNHMQHERIADAFVAGHGDEVTRSDLEYGLFSTLVANMETCLRVADIMSEFELGPALKDKLARRYEGVNELLADKPLSAAQLIDIGADTILIVPVVGYYVAVIGEILRPTSGYKTVLEDGSLLSALHDAATLIRLLNDLGTGVLEQTSDERRMMIGQLRTARHDGDTFDQILLNVSQRYGAPLTRLKKDLKFGEFNVGLYTPLRVDNIEDSITIFEENLTYLSEVYHSKQKALHQTARHLSHRLGGAAIAEAIVRSVRFHQVVYSQSFEDAGGEYAI